MQTQAGAVKLSRIIGIVIAALALMIPMACGGTLVDPKHAARDQAQFRAYGAGGSGAAPGGGFGDGDFGDGGFGDGDFGDGDFGDGDFGDGDFGDGEPGDLGGGGDGAASGGGTASGGGASGGGGAAAGGGSGGGAKGGGKAAGGGGGGGKATAGVKVASCDGFKNGTGITNDFIVIGNTSDLSGPVGGLFAGAQQGVRAFVNYFNATSDICGRKLKLETDNSKTDAASDQRAYQKFCGSVFAAVGSMSAFDSGGAKTAENCGLPDMRASAVTGSRVNCKTCFGAQSTGAGEYGNAAYDWVVKNHKAASQKGAFIYLDAGAAAENGKVQISVAQKRGVKWAYTAAAGAMEMDYSPFVAQMKSRGVEFVNFIGAYQHSARLAQAMQKANFKPKVLMYDPSVYDANFLKAGGSAIEGAVVYINFTPLEESQPELDLYKQWLQRTAPGATPDFFGMFGWSAARLFSEKALELGGNLNRASLVQALSKVKNWTGRGMHAGMSVGDKHPPECWRFMQVKGGKFVPLGSTKYQCFGYSKG